MCQILFREFFFFPSLQNLIPTGPPRCILNLVNHPAQ